MGNCFGGSNSDDSTLLQESHEGRSEHSVAADPGQSSAQNAAYANERLNTNDRSHHAAVSISSSSASHSEDEQIRRIQRVGLIQHLPTDIFLEGGKSSHECVICMMEFEEGDRIRFLPCMHSFHCSCIDSWLLKSFTCPSCMEPVDSALLTSFYDTEMVKPSSLPVVPFDQSQSQPAPADASTGVVSRSSADACGSE